MLLLAGTALDDDALFVIYAQYFARAQPVSGDLRSTYIIPVTSAVQRSVILVIMRPSSLGGGRILRRTLSVCPSVRPSRYRCHR